MAGRNCLLYTARRIAGGARRPGSSPGDMIKGAAGDAPPAEGRGPRARAHTREGPATTRVTGPSRHANAPRWSATSCSPTDYSAVPSALGGLTSGFGMGPGVPPPPWSLTNEGHSVFRGRAPPGALGAAQRSRAQTEGRPTATPESQGEEELGLLVQLG